MTSARARSRQCPTRRCHKTLWSRLLGGKDFSHLSERTLQLSQSRFLCAGHLEGDSDADMDVRYTRHIEFQSLESASAHCTFAWIFRLHSARCESAAEREH